MEDPLPPPLMAAKSIKLVLQLILQQNRQKAENRKAHQKANAGGGDGVHSAAHLLEGGACLNEDKRWGCDPDERAEPEWRKGHPDHRRDNVDEPVGEEGGDAEEDDVGEQIAALRLHLAAPLGCSFRKVMSD